MQRLILLSCVLLCSCGEFSYGPFTGNIDEKKYNDKNFISIKNAESVFESEFKILVLSDTHNYYDDLFAAIESINRTKDDVAFAVVTGDITNLSLPKEYLIASMYFNRLKVPYLTVVGNHDLLIDGELIFKRIFGALNFSLKFKNSLFIFLNNNSWESSVDAPDLSWLENELINKYSENILIFMHIEPDYPSRFSPIVISEFNRLIKDYNIDYVIHGHRHNHGVSKLEHAVQLTVGSVSKRKYIQLDISDEKISHKVIRF